MEYRTNIENITPNMLPKILTLFQTSFPKGSKLLTKSYHDWLYLQNPFGPAKAVYVCTNGEWAGFMALVPVQLARKGETMNAYFAVNVLVDPSYRGRNLFARMITAASEFAKNENAALLGHPNAAAFLFWKRKKMHFQQELRPTLAIPGPSRWSLTSRTAASSETLREGIASFEQIVGESSRWKIAATPEYLEWRFIKHPSNSYSVQILEHKGIAVGVQVTKRIKPGLHMFIDHFVDASFKNAALAKLPVFTVSFVPDDLVTEIGRRLLRLPWKKRLPIFFTNFEHPVLAHSTSEIALSASDF